MNNVSKDSKTWQYYSNWNIDFYNDFFSLDFQVRWLNRIHGSSGNMRYQNWQILSVVCVAKKIIFLLLFKSSKFYNSADLEILFGFLCLSGERFKFFRKLWKFWVTQDFYVIRDWSYFVLINMEKRIFKEHKPKNSCNILNSFKR